MMPVTNSWQLHAVQYNAAVAWCSIILCWQWRGKQGAALAVVQTLQSSYVFLLLDMTAFDYSCYSGL
jgi:hypothetical protein